MTEPAPSLFGIEFTDRLARLVAADIAEEKALVRLAAALRDTGRPLVLENRSPHVQVDNPSLWNVRAEPAMPGQATSGVTGDVLVNLAKKLGHQLHMNVCVVVDQGGRVSPKINYQPVRFRRVTLNAVEALRDDHQGIVKPGVALVETGHWKAAVPVVHIHGDDANAFGLIYVPAFSDGR